LSLLWGLLILVIIGSILIWIAGLLIAFLPAFTLSALVYWTSGSDILAGAAFLGVALLSLTRRRRRSDLLA